MRHDAWSSLAQANVPHLLQRMVPLRLEQGSRSRAELCGSLCSEVERCVGEVDELRRGGAGKRIAIASWLDPASDRLWVRVWVGVVCPRFNHNS